MKKWIFLFVVFVGFAGVFVLTNKNYATDFAVYYNAAKSFINSGTISYLSDGAFCTGQYEYMPVSILLFVSFTLFSFNTASIIWHLFNSIILTAGVFFIWKVTGTEKKTLILFFLPLTIFFYPAKVGLTLGQVSIFIFFIYAVSFYCLLQNKDSWCGFLLSIPVILKITPLVFLVFALTVRRRKMFFSMLISIVFWFLLSFIIFGLKANLDFVRHLVYIFYNSSCNSQQNLISITAFLTAIFRHSHFLVVLNYTIFVFLLVATIKIKNLRYGFCAFILLTILLSKFSQSHWYVWTLVPIFFLINELKTNKKYIQVSVVIISYLLINTSDTLFFVCVAKNYFPGTTMVVHFLPVIGATMLLFQNMLTEQR